MSKPTIDQQDLRRFMVNLRKQFNSAGSKCFLNNALRTALNDTRGDRTAKGYVSMDIGSEFALFQAINDSAWEVE